MFLGKVAIVDWPNESSLDLFHIAAVANPFRAQRRQTSFDIAVKFRVAPRPTGVVNTRRLVKLERFVERFSWRERNLPERDAQIDMDFSDDVNLA